MFSITQTQTTLHCYHSHNSGLGHSGWSKKLHHITCEDLCENPSNQFVWCVELAEHWSLLATQAVAAAGRLAWQGLRNNNWFSNKESPLNMFPPLACWGPLGPCVGLVMDDAAGHYVDAVYQIRVHRLWVSRGLFTTLYSLYTLCTVTEACVV